MMHLLLLEKPSEPINLSSAICQLMLRVMDDAIVVFQEYPDVRASIVRLYPVLQVSL